MKHRVSSETSVKLSDLERVIGYLDDNDSEFIGRMTQCELDSEMISDIDLGRINRLHVEHCR